MDFIPEDLTQDNDSGISLMQKTVPAANDRCITNHNISNFIITNHSFFRNIYKYEIYNEKYNKRVTLFFYIQDIRYAG